MTFITRPSIVRLIILVFVFISAASAQPSSPVEPAGVQNDPLQQLFEEEWQFRLEEFPELAEDQGDESASGRMTRMAPDDLTRRVDFWRGIKQRADAFDCDTLEQQDCINLRLFQRQINHYIRDYETRGHLLPFNSDWGFYISWTRWPETTAFNDEQDYRRYLQKLEMLPAVMDEYIGLLETAIDLGFTQPRAVLEGRDEPIRAQVVDQASESAFYQPLVGELNGVSSETAEELRQQAKTVINQRLVPAYRKLLTFYNEEYLPNARKTLAAHELPGGEAFYQEQIRWYATVDLSPEEIHQIGLSEVSRIKAQMLEIIDEVGFEGDLQAFIGHLRSEPQFYAETSHELLAEASYFAKKMDGKLPALFGKLPRQPYGVAPVPEEIAPFYTAGRYIGAPLVAPRGGYYWVNTHDLKSRPLYALPALTLHEAVPGHHLQNALAKELSEQPPFRRGDYISAYGEGWALYAEKLGVEADIYETPYHHFGRLTYEMWRAARLVIDTGIHAKGWTRKQAQDYLANHTALSRHEVNTEIDRYISWPGQALSYKLGELKIIELRELAEESLAEEFDLRAFHDQLLSLGSVPLDVLEEEMKKWLDQQIQLK